MATKITSGGGDAVLGGLLGAAGVSLALSTSAAVDATQAASGELAAAGGYARVAAPAWTKTDAANGRQWATSAQVRWAFTAAVAGTVRSVQLWSAANGGNLLASVDLEAPVSGLGSGSAVAIPAGALLFVA